MQDAQEVSQKLAGKPRLIGLLQVLDNLRDKYQDYHAVHSLFEGMHGIEDIWIKEEIENNPDVK